jgi:hypothetical protein
MLPVRILQKP